MHVIMMWILLTWLLILLYDMVHGLHMYNYMFYTVLLMAFWCWLLCICTTNSCNDIFAIRYLSLNFCLQPFCDWYIGNIFLQVQFKLRSAMDVRGILDKFTNVCHLCRCMDNCSMNLFCRLCFAHKLADWCHSTLVILYDMFLCAMLNQYRFILSITWFKGDTFRFYKC